MTKAHFFAAPQIIMPFGYAYIMYVAVIDYFLFEKHPRYLYHHWGRHDHRIRLIYYV